GEVIDHVGGLEDLRAGRLRVLGDPSRRMMEDPVRMIRAVRFAATLGFEIDSPAREAMILSAERLSEASPARLYDEIQKLFFCGRAGRVLDMLVDYRLLDVLFPDLSVWARREEQGLAWLKRVARQVDIWRQAGHDVSPDLFLALLCGPYHEQVAALEIAAGAHPSGALEDAALTHLRALSKRISVPRAAAYHAARILAAQPRFRLVPARRLNRFLESALFRDAYIYFKMTERFNGRNPEALAWWEQTLGQGRGPENAERSLPPGSKSEKEIVQSLRSE
ncbi:MAG: hypothetical protein U1E27_10360, partial [Kiritimatiellia bacterium]|nr:hypothetical protein [Kiritimatiellia bacterium]